MPQRTMNNDKDDDLELDDALDLGAHAIGRVLGFFLVGVPRPRHAVARGIRSITKTAASAGTHSGPTPWADSRSHATAAPRTRTIRPIVPAAAADTCRRRDF